MINLVHTIETAKKKEEPFVKGIMDWYGSMIFGKKTVSKGGGKEDTLDTSFDGSHD